MVIRLVGLMAESMADVMVGQLEKRKVAVRVRWWAVEMVELMVWL